jgi:DNA-binding response OmpR family regulator
MNLDILALQLLLLNTKPTLEKAHMRDGFIILIADRNRNVRGFLRREFEEEGYLVRLAKNGKEVLRMARVGVVPDLLILDLDMPYVDGVKILEQLKDKEPSMPIVIHTTSLEYEGHSALREAAAFVEKTGNNTSHLKELVEETLRRYHPHRFMHAKGQPEDKKSEVPRRD